ncbi:MAG: helix-turn-helix domain-containing protein [Candidatus Ornithomonoglobus sp.]
MNKQPGIRIRELREKNKFTREELAEQLGITSKFLSDIEIGKCGFSVPTLIKICETLHTTSDYILFGKIDILTPLARDMEKLKEYEFENLLTIIYAYIDALTR